VHVQTDLERAIAAYRRHGFDGAPYRLMRKATSPG
jgi:hypothetical protein